MASTPKPWGATILMKHPVGPSAPIGIKPATQRIGLKRCVRDEGVARIVQNFAACRSVASFSSNSPQHF